jgi:DNA repair exonuclease SbcCD ATPase subunit
MEGSELFEQLQRLQIENAALHERISELKRQNSEQDAFPDDSESEAYAAEISALKAQIVVEQQETSKCKQELAELIRHQEELQAQLEIESTLVVGTLVPHVQREEQETQSYYDLLLSKCAQIPEIDIAALRELVETVQLKRRSLADATAENQKIHRLIALHQAQLSDPAPTPIIKPSNPTVSSRQPQIGLTPSTDVFENPLPCLVTEAASTPVTGVGGTHRRRRVLFKGKDAL